MGVLGEVFMRATRPFEEKRRMYMRTRTVFQYEPENVRFDERLGFFHLANLSTRFENLEYDVPVETNSAGFRDDEASLHDPKVLVLGDSFAFGWGVREEDDFASVLERSIREPVLDMGVAGYATTQELLLLEDWVGAHPFEGGLCVVQFYGNDVGGSEKEPGGLFPAVVPSAHGFELSRVDRDTYERTLVRNRAAMSPKWVRHSYLADMCLQVYARGHDKLVRMGVLGGPQWLFPEAPDETAPPETDRGEAGAPALRRPLHRVIAEMARFAEAERFRLVFLYVPPVRYFEGSKGYDAESFAALAPVLEELSIDLIDMRPLLTREDYFEMDDHWRASGHRKAAMAIAAYMETQESSDLPPEDEGR